MFWQALIFAAASAWKCCDYDTPQGLYSCTVEAANEQRHGDVVLVSYASSSIEGYAAYSFALMQTFAKERQYGLHLLSPLDGSNYEPRDQRWNRVKILSRILEEGAVEVSHAVWFDADLAFLDRSLDLRSIIAVHPNHDIIISAERHAETGVANTGCFIVRNSAWSRWFLTQWWDRYDRSQHHDQIFFDKLYRSLSPNERDEHIAVLPVTALNSAPPPMLMQGEADPVLHLMGESSELRQKAFALAWAAVCNASSSSSSAVALPPQLGLARPVLLQLAVEDWSAKLQSALADARTEAASGRLKEALTALGRARESLVQLRKLGGGGGGNGVGEALSEVYKHTLELLSLARSLPSPSSSLLVDALNACATVGQDWSQEVAAGADANVVVAQVRQCLDELLPRVHASSKVLVREMLVMHLNSLSDLRLRQGRGTEALATMKETLAETRRGEAEGMNPHHAVAAYLSLGSALCLDPTVKTSAGREEGLSLLQMALAKQEALLGADKQWKQDHGRLAHTLLVLGLCTLLPPSASSVSKSSEAQSATAATNAAAAATAAAAGAGAGAAAARASASALLRRAEAILRDHPEGPVWTVDMASPLRALRTQLQQQVGTKAEVEVGAEEPATRVIYRRRKRRQST